MKEFIFLIVLFIANIIQAITGFAGTVLAMPASMFLLGIDDAKVVLNVMALISGLLIAISSYKSINKKELLKICTIMIIGMCIGVKTLKLDIPLVLETRINWGFVPLHIAIIYILKLCLGEEIIPRCRFPCSRGYLIKCINWQKKQSFSVSQSYRKS